MRPDRDHQLNRASWDELAAAHGQDANYDHSFGEIVTAAAAAGLRVTQLVEHTELSATSATPASRARQTGGIAGGWTGTSRRCCSR
jgi:hypothetical protein